MNEKMMCELEAIPLERVKSPNLPMHTALGEASDLLTFCRRGRIEEALLRVGLEEGFLEVYAERLEAARETQSNWVQVRDRRKPKALIELEESAAALRSQIIAAGRWCLRGERDAQATLSSISGGDGVDDLVQDLRDLAVLLERNLPAFERDRSFDAPTRAAEARELARCLSSLVSDERSELEPSEVRLLRDRAFTHLDEIVSDVRAAGRYAFRLEPEVLPFFTSRYRRRVRRAARRDEEASESIQQATQDVVEEGVTGEVIAEVA